MKNLSTTARIITSVFLAFGAGTALSQDFPNKTLRIFAGSAGSGGDQLARLIAAGIAGPLGQSVIVENRVALISAETVAKAPPDGHTMIIQGGGLWLRPLLERMSWDAVRDFAPISRLVDEANVLVVHPSLPVKSVKELIAYIKTRPGQLNYGSSGVGSTNHLSTELFKSMAGLYVVHIPMRSQVSLTSLMSGDVHMLITDVGLVSQHIKAGKMRALAVATAKPSALAPGLPTVAASGLPGFEVVSTTGLWATAKTPEKTVARLNQEVRRVLTRPEVREKFLATGVEVVASTPEEFAATIKSEIIRMTKVIKDAKIQVE